MNDLDTERGRWLFLDACEQLNLHYIEGGWEKIMEKFPEEINYLEERLNQHWNAKVIIEWENGIKEYLIECNCWRE
jgi:hypothetical protein